MRTLLTGLRFLFIIFSSPVKADDHHHQEFIIIDESDGQVNFIGSSNANGSGGTEECIRKGSFHFPGEYTYEGASKLCMRRGGELLLFSFALGCESGTFHSNYQDALCLHNCTNSDNVTSIISNQITAKYPSCSPSNIQFIRDISSTARCLDKTREIGANMEVLKAKFSITHTIENDSIHFSQIDTRAFSEECTNETGQIVLSSFVEKVLIHDLNTPGSCKFTEMLDEETDSVKVYNWPRCFASSCSPQLIRNLLSGPENQSKWYCSRDVFSVDFRAITENMHDKINNTNVNANENENKPSSTPNAGSGHQNWFTIWALLSGALSLHLILC